MKKSTPLLQRGKPRLLFKLFLMTKLSILLILFGVIQVQARVIAQGSITLNMQQVSIEKVLNKIEKNGEFRFLYNYDLKSLKKKVSVAVQNSSLKETLNNLFANTDLTYKLLENNLVVVVSSTMPDQNIRITGKVTGENGEPLEGVSVRIKGGTAGTMTDNLGNYTLTVPNNAVLEISYIGYEILDMPVEGKNIVNIQLKASTKPMDQVVVIGYGVQKKSVVTGAISSVKSTDLENMPIARIEQALQGRTSGLTIAASSGQPGASSTVRVRGTTSINNSDPLYVVDGVPIDIGGIDYLNQSDIESIEVLKDAASAAIYGTKAASGVILITTKKGRSGKMRVAYNGYYGTQAPARKLSLLNATEYATLRNESSVAAGKGIIFPNPQALGEGTDWQHYIFNNSAKIQNHELSISGGSDKSTYYGSFGYYDQEGIVATDISHYTRFTIRFNSAHKINNWLNFGNNISYAHIKSLGGLNTNSEFGGPLSSAINLDPITPVVITDPAVAAGNPYSNNPVIRDANGNPYGISKYVGQEMTNPIAYVQTRLKNYGWSDNFVGNVYAEIEPVKGLKLRSSIGAKKAFYGGESFTPLYYLSATQNNLTNTSFYRESNRGLIWNWDNTLSYTRGFGFHNLSALVGTSAQQNSQTGLNGVYFGIPATNFDQASLNYSVPTASRVAGGWEGQPYHLSSYFGRVTYDYDGKYLFTGILRVDGSSRFGINNKYASFPSASFGWVPTRENFWPVNDVVTNLKIRGSYGITGNDNSPDFAYVSTIGGGRNYTVGNAINIGNSPNAPANPDLKWEQTSQADLGFDASLFHDFYVTFDVYNKKTTGMLLGITLPGYVGASGKPFGNIASLTDKGYELEMGYNKVISQVKINLKGNASYVKNTITSIGVNGFLGGQSFQASAYEISRTMVGHPIASFYGFKTLGIFQTQADVNNYVDKSGQMIQPGAKPGDFRYADLDGDGKITAADRTFIGDPTPHWTFGFTASADWKNFDLLIFGQGVSGNQVFQGLRRLDILTGNYSTKALNRWTGPGTSNSFPRLIDGDPNSNFSNPTSFYLEDGAYFRIKTIQLGYSLPKSLISRIGVEKARFYISTNNLLTFTKYTGYDPEIGGGSYGIDRGIYPQARTLMLGANIGF